MTRAHIFFCLMLTRALTPLRAGLHAADLRENRDQM